MALEKIDIKNVIKIVSQLAEQISCLECCKYYIVPETASCGHTLCHLCWKKRRTCPHCQFPVNRETKKINLPLQTLTDHCQNLCNSLETLLNIKLDDFTFITPGEIEPGNCPIANVNEWLEGSQNHFSAPITNHKSLSQEVHINQELSTSKVQIHTHTEMKKAPTSIVHISTPQEDWDKIESVPENYEIITNKENIIGPMDIEPFDIHDKEYTLNNPRRSSRKRDLKEPVGNSTIEENVVNRNICKDSSGDTDKTSHNVKQNWNNVKKMRKEFSKLNKKNRNKLDVSIEMCKKTKNSGKNLNIKSPIKSNEEIGEIDENTQNLDSSVMLPSVTNEKVNKPDGNVNINVREENISDKNKPATLSNTYTDQTMSQAIDHYNLKVKDNVDFSEKEQTILSKNTTSNINKCDFMVKSNKVKFFKKGILYPSTQKYISTHGTNNVYIDTASEPDSGDIDISIKIGNTLTNIFIKQKKTDVQVKANTDSAVQTSLGFNQMIQTNNTCQSHVINVNNTQINAEDNNNKGPLQINNSENVQTLPKKNTASTDTRTAHFEITESVEKELSNVMVCENNDKFSINSVKNIIKTTQTKLTPVASINVADEEVIHNNDPDIFDSEAMKESNVVLLKDSEYASSDILMPTIKTKVKSQKNTDKREREIHESDDDVDVQIPKKKIKVVNENVSITNNTAGCIKSNNIEDSDNYDALMNQVFANIDADINGVTQSQSNKDIISVHISPASKEIINGKNVATSQVVNTQRSNNTLHPYRDEQTSSENLFSAIEKHNSIRDKNKKVPSSAALQTIEEILTPVICHNLETSLECSLKAAEDLNDSSEKYVVEDTPQKIQNLIKPKHKTDSIKSKEYQSRGSSTVDKLSVSSDKNDNIVTLNETLESRKNSKNNTAIEVINKKEMLETPLTINKFVNHIMHKSTPVARKSLSFENQNAANYNEPEETICPTVESVVKNTQEKEFMYKAFEKSPEILHKPVAKNDILITNTRLCVAGSCLASDELRKLKYLCTERKWLYVDKYRDDITHLVVAVDEQNKCQRSVKYMRALAAGKWIISFEWVERCLIAKKYVDETQYEALDNTGVPGPKRSRVSKRKIFQGITFFCMPPFSVLDVASLKDLLIDAGGVVVNEAKKVQVTDSTKGPCLLLAEPENTQEDQFIYLAMELNIVPVNFEWVLNCLGTYTLGSIQELLLCPSSLLPKAISKWPSALFTYDI